MTCVFLSPLAVVGFHSSDDVGLRATYGFVEVAKVGGHDSKQNLEERLIKIQNAKADDGSRRWEASLKRCPANTRLSMRGHRCLAVN